MDQYRDRRIECTDRGISVRGYYFPWGTKRIHYASIRALDRFAMTVTGGRAGSGDRETSSHWANFDPGRPRKSVGFFVDVGARIVPFLTPDDPDAFERIVRARTGLAS